MVNQTFRESKCADGLGPWHSRTHTLSSVSEDEASEIWASARSALSGPFPILSCDHSSGLGLNSAASNVQLILGPNLLRRFALLTPS